MKRKLTITYDYLNSEVSIDNTDGEGFTDMEIFGLLEFVKVMIVERRVSHD